MSKWMIMDCCSLLEQSFYLVPCFENEKNVFEGVVNVIKKALDEVNPQFAVAVFADTENEVRRYPSFVKKHWKQLMELLKNNGMYCVNADASIVRIASNTCKEQPNTDILTVDMEALALVEETVSVIIPNVNAEENNFTKVTLDEFKDTYGVMPDKMIDLLAIAGNPNIGWVGANGVGKLQATKQLNENDFDAYVEQLKSLQMIDETLEKQMAQYRSAFDKENALTIVIDSEAADCSKIHWEESKKELVKTANTKSVSKPQQEKEEKKKPTVDMEVIKSKFVKISSWKQVEEVFKNIVADKECMPAIQLLVEDKFYKDYFELDDEVEMEQEGQMSLFALPQTKKINYVLAVSICVNEMCYVMDTNAEWFDIKSFTEQLYDLHKTGKIVIVHDLKKYMYVLKHLVMANGVDNHLDADWFEKNVKDVSLAKYLLDPLHESYEIDYLALDELGITMETQKEFLGKLTWEQKKEEALEAFNEMLCLQAYVVAHVWKLLEAELENTKQKELYDEMELPLVSVLFEMEQRGILVNKEQLKSYGDGLVVRIEELEKKIYEEAGEEFNINSPKQLGVVLFEKMGLPGGKKTKSGFSTSADVLEGLKAEYKIVADVLEYRQYTKLKSTYADGLANYICSQDGRIHGRFNQTITATGRLSSAEPNLQNIPIRMEIGRQIREVFVPKEGCVFLDADYSQIELRLLAHMSGDESLIKAYNSGKDIHRITASEVFHTPFEDVTKELRGKAKAVNFGIVYGISSFGLGQDLNISRKEAEEYIERYFETYPGIKKYLDTSVEQGKTNGYAVSMCGRRRPLPELSSSNYMQRQFGERIAMNMPIQGTAADLMKLAMLHVERRMRKEQLKSQLLLQIHDELLVETYTDEISKVETILKEEMEGVMKLFVSLEVEVEQGNNWNEAH